MGGAVGVLNFQVLSLKACCTLKKPIFLAKSDTLCPKCTKGWSGTSDLGLISRKKNLGVFFPYLLNFEDIDLTTVRAIYVIRALQQ